MADDAPATFAFYVISDAAQNVVKKNHITKKAIAPLQGELLLTEPVAAALLEWSATLPTAGLPSQERLSATCVSLLLS